MTIQLTDAQAAVLAPALARADRCIYPVTAELTGGAVGNIAKSLLKRGLLEEVPATDNGRVWRCGEDSIPLTLRATDLAGEICRGIVHASEHQQALVEPTAVPHRKRGAAQEALLAILNRTEGGTIAELQAATGWLAHSVRGALSAVIAKKLGHTVTSAKEGDRGRVYRVTG